MRTQHESIRLALIGGTNHLSCKQAYQLLLMRKTRLPGHAAIDIGRNEICRFGATRAVLNKIVATGSWQSSQRIPYFLTNPFVGFVSAAEYFPAAVLAADDGHHDILARGLGHQLGTIIPMPTGRLAAYVVTAETTPGPHDGSIVATFDSLCSHLARGTHCCTAWA